MEPGEKRCLLCGRVGTRAFRPLDPRDRSPYAQVKCEFEPACTRRWIAKVEARDAERAKEGDLGDPVEPPVEVEPVDLDAIQGINPTRE